jgi:putative addiction module antidote
MIKLTVRQVGNSTGIILPKEALTRLQIDVGDPVFLVETPTGYEVTAYNPEFEAQLKSAQKGMRAYRNTLRELAK